VEKVVEQILHGQPVRIVSVRRIDLPGNPAGTGG
jgi:hypothetical protein